MIGDYPVDAVRKIQHHPVAASDAEPRETAGVTARPFLDLLEGCRAALAKHGDCDPFAEAPSCLMDESGHGSGHVDAVGQTISRRASKRQNSRGLPLALFPTSSRTGCPIDNSPVAAPNTFVVIQGPSSTRTIATL